MRIGDRVRIDAPKLRFDRLVGTVSGFTPTTVVLVTRDTTLIIPHDSIREFSVSRGKRRHIGKGSLIGATAGGLVFAIGFRNSVNPCVDEPICLNIIDKKEAFNLGAIVGSMAGGFTGAIIGALIQTERWEKQPLPVSVSLAPTIRGRRPVAPTVSVRVPLSR
ncbi:MAG: hypothetical protein R3224_06480 [Balneolaceae bacterium]|nr:hypothetical protein [Balneolaceae bacterium]